MNVRFFVQTVKLKKTMKIRINTVTEMKNKPEIRLINKFLSEAGFSVGDKITITYQYQKITISKETVDKNTTVQEGRLF